MEPKEISGQAKCSPCEGGLQPLNAQEIASFMKSAEGWTYIPAQRSIHTEFKTKDFMAAVRFIQDVAALAEEQGHHPDIHLTGYKNLAFDLTTHTAKGLTTNDFLMAKLISRKFIESFPAG